MILYHGTNIDFNEIHLSESRIGKDFGFGFYLTPDKHVATRQAERKVRQMGDGDSIVQAYFFDDTMLYSLKLLHFDSYTEDWADFILMNRQHKKPFSVHDYDIVIGPIADDTVGFQIRRYTNGIINKSQFLEEIKYHEVTIQYFFGTDKSLALLRRYE